MKVYICIYRNIFCMRAVEEPFERFEMDNTFPGGIWSPPNADTQGLIPPVPREMRNSPMRAPATISV